MARPPEEKKMFRCSNCGGIMQFDIPKQQFACPNCGHVEAVPDSDGVVSEFDFMSVQENDPQWSDQTHVLKCDNCGAEIVTGASETTANCSFCGSSHVLESKQMAGIKPEAVIPFKIDKTGARELFRKWVSHKFFAPNALKRAFQEDKLDAMYMPFWTYDAFGNAHYTGRGGKVYYVTVGSGQQRHQEMRIQWYPVSGSLSHAFDDVLVSAQAERDPLVDMAESSYNTAACQPFSTAYLSGYKAKRYTRGVKDAFVEAKQRMIDFFVQMAYTDIMTRFDRADSVSVEAQFSNIKYKHVLLPLWMSGYMFKNKFFRYVINGQTGTVQGRYPKSKIKVAITVIAILAVLGVLIWLAVQSGWFQ